MGWESGIDKDFRQAPQFFWLFTIIIILSAGIILISDTPLTMIMFLSQVGNGAVLPFVLIFMLKRVNDRRLIEEYGNDCNDPVDRCHDGRSRFPRDNGTTDKACLIFSCTLDSMKGSDILKLRNDL